MKNFYTLLLVCFLSIPVFSQTSIDSGFEFDGVERTFRIILPTSYVEGEPMPLVFNFHGFGSNSFEQLLYSRMDAVAEEHNFICIFPEGVEGGWNVGWAFGSEEDDVGFTNAMIDTLSAQYTIDQDRIFACGMSNGGFFSYKLACELNDRIAKVASVTGSMLQSEIDICMPDNPTPVMQIHGTADPVVAYNGTPGVSTGIEDVLEHWRVTNGCPLESDTIEVEDIDPLDLTTSKLIQYRDCNGDTYMAFYKVAFGGHTWPGAAINVGVTSQDFDASQEIWRFFNDEYPLTGTITSANEPQLDPLSIQLFPNPVTDQFSLVVEQTTIDAVQIFDTRGQLLDQENNLESTTIELDASTWASGIYFAKVFTTSGTQTIKVVKQ